MGEPQGSQLSRERAETDPIDFSLLQDMENSRWGLHLLANSAALAKKSFFQPHHAAHQGRRDPRIKVQRHR